MLTLSSDPLLTGTDPEMLWLGLAASDPGICVLVIWLQKSLCDLYRSVFTSVLVREDIYLLLVSYILSKHSAGVRGSHLVSFQVLGLG